MPRSWIPRRFFREHSLAPCALRRSAGGSVIDKSNHTSQVARTRPASDPATSPHVTTLVTRKSGRSSCEGPASLVGEGGTRVARISTLATSPSVGYHAPGRAQSGRKPSGYRAVAERVPVGLGVSLSTAVRQPRSFVSYRGRHFAARDAAPPFRVRTPCRRHAAPRRRARGCALTCGWTCVSARGTDAPSLRDASVRPTESSAARSGAGARGPPPPLPSVAFARRTY